MFKAPTVPSAVSLTSELAAAAKFRCDATLGSGASAGCVVPASTPQLILSLSFQKLAATHVAVAQNSGLPGSYSSERPLTRTTSAALTNQNRSKSCPSSMKRPSGYQCDEYPFASTREGASSGGGTGRTFSGCQITAYPTGITGSKGYSACMIPQADNASGGGKIGSFYIAQRVVDGDKFWVDVTY